VPRLPRSQTFRRRAAAVAGVLALYALIRFVPAPGIPCGVSAVKECDDGADAIALVPADAYAYGHVELDPDSGQVEQAGELAAKLPSFEEILQGSLQAAGDLDAGIDLRSEVYPWLGDEIAFAVVPGPRGAPLPLALLGTEDPEDAERFAASIGASFRLRDDFILLGEAPALRAADQAEGTAEGSLEDDDAAAEVLGGLSDERVADAYVSEEGIGRLLLGRGGLAAQLGTFADYRASTGIGAAAVAEDAGIRLELHSDLDPERAEATPGFFAAFPEFEPRLAEALAPGTLAMLGIGDPSRTIRALLEQADAAVPGISAAFDRLNANLQRQGAVDLEDGLVPLLRGEAAAAIAPGRPVPYATLVFDEVDEARVREAVARLQAPLVAALDPARTGVAPTFSERQVDGVPVRALRISRAIDLTYAVFDGKLVISTGPEGVEQAISGEDSLAGDESFQTVTAGSSDGVSALVFLNLEGLVELAEPIGLAEIVAGFRADLDTLEALGLTIRSDEDSLDTKIFLEIRSERQNASADD
jgi:hypothetical protein